MPLNIGSSENEFTPYLKYTAKAGRFYIRLPGTEADIEITNPRLAIDMANIRTGWLCFAEGMGPEKVWDLSPDQVAPRPPGPRKFKRGFEVMVFGPDKIQGTTSIIGLREWASNAGSTGDAINKMYAAYETGRAANPSKVPVYVGTGVIPIAFANGTNYEPRFELKSWVERSKVPAFDEYLGKQATKAPPPPPAQPAAVNELNPPPPVFGDDGFGQDVPF